MTEEAAAFKLETALSMAATLFPNAAQILAMMDVRLDARAQTAAVTSSGRMLVSPTFLDTLTVQQTVFVVAHELHHVMYGVFDRFDSNTSPRRRWLVNIAHDFIVNDMLEKKFEADAFKARAGKVLASGDRASKSQYIPSEGLFWTDYAKSYRKIVGHEQPPLDTFTLESLVLELERISSELPAGNPLDRLARKEKPTNQPWGQGLGGLLEGLKATMDEEAAEKEERQEDEVSNGDGGDHDLSDILGRLPELLTESEEAELFPEETAVERSSCREKIKAARELATARSAIDRTVNAGHDMKPGDGDAVVHALEGQWSTPWERALQKWLDDTTPPVRTWAKASRRAGDRADVVLPGRVNDGHILYIVVDTSGSMEDTLPAAFGMIQSFGRNNGVHAVRIVQCDAEVTADDIVDIDDLADFNVEGFGGSDMSPGLLRLADDPSVEAAIVLTDGGIDYPPKDKIPFEVLWCVFDWSGDLSWFTPDYGEVIAIPADQFSNN